MNDCYNEFSTIEEFIFNDHFVELVKRNDPDEIAGLFYLYPEKQDIMNNAIVLLRYLKIEFPDIPDTQIDEDWNIIHRRIAEKKRLKRHKRLYLWTVSAVATCAAIILLVFINPLQNNITEEEYLFTLMESTDMHDGEVQIIAGSEQANVGNDETIVQTEEGSLLVGKDQKMESSSIKVDYLTVVVPKGKRATVELSDGSTIWINSETKIVYPKVFGDKNREIIIDGEAYLDIAKNENKPFIVHTKDFNIQVLGTKFNISAYSNDKKNSVVLVEGCVEITAESSKRKLFPNQGFFIEDGNTSIRNVNVYLYVGWKDAIMQLDGESLGNIMKTLSRYYGLDIQCSDTLAKERYRGKIDLKKPIETVLHNISLSTPLTYTRNEDIIYVK